MRLRRRKGGPEGRREEAWTPPVHDAGYRGPAVLEVGGERLPVEVHLSGHLEPLDGRYHWYGRITGTPGLSAAKEAGATTVLLAIGGGAPAPGRLAEHDAWGNLRVTGVGRPPFPLEPVDLDLPRTIP